MAYMMEDFKESEYTRASAFVKVDDEKYWERFGFKQTGEMKGSSNAKWRTMHKEK
jgi:predicted N-acetyltransferase YhbS